MKQRFDFDGTDWLLIKKRKLFLAEILTNKIFYVN